MSVNRHILKFTPAPENWDQAFPIGNGRLGAMGYQPPGQMVFHFDQLDVTASPYHWLDEYPQYQPLDFTCRRAREAHADPADPAHQDYNKIIHEEVFREYGYPPQQLMSPHCGELMLCFCDGTGETSQNLPLSEAVLEMRRDAWCVRAFASMDYECVIVEVETNSGWNGLTSVRYYPDPLFPAVPVCVNEHSAVTEVHPGGSFHFSAGLRILEGGTLLCESGYVAVHPEEKAVRMIFAFAVETSFRSATPRDTVCEWLEAAASAGVGQIREAHEAWWRDYWNRSQVTLEDDMLEYLWYFGNYTFASGNGRGCGNSGICGLYGLWYHAPTIWHNGMVEDVNIQEAFWQVFTSGHADLAQPLIEAIERRLPAARLQARNWYNCPGAVFGYYPMQCIGPWFCEYLWWYYSYRGDEEFLKERAYPVFREVLTFFEAFATIRNGKMVIFPTVSPEQGPVAENDTQTLASLKFLVSRSLETARKYGWSDDAARWQKMLAALPDYPISGTAAPFIKDSDWAGDDLFLAHPGVLHPIYPCYEIRGKLAENTLSYAEHHQALGTFNFTWLAAAAAANGNGDEALRILYEKGIQYLLKSNGFFAEVNDHFTQACSVLYSPCYGSALLEASSGTVAALNAMLLQSRPDGIAVFPAVPSGWKDVEFSGLIAEVNIRVNAVRRQGHTVRVELCSPLAQTVHLYNPFGGGRVLCNGNPLATAEDWILELRPGRPLVLAAGEMPAAKEKEAVKMPLVYQCGCGRRIFIGADQNTAFREVLDSFYYPAQLGMFEIPKVTRYKFDFGDPSIPKHYGDFLPQQFLPPNKVGRDFVRVGCDYKFDYRVSSLRWMPGEDCVAFVRTGEDCLRFDGLTGVQNAEFSLFFTAGSYRMLLVSGDPECKDNGTVITFPDGKIWRAEFDRLGFAVISFDIRNSGEHIWRIESEPGRRWYLNLCIINQNF